MWYSWIFEKEAILDFVDYSDMIMVNNIKNEFLIP